MKTSLKMMLKFVVLFLAVMSTTVGSVQTESAQTDREVCFPCGVIPGLICCSPPVPPAQKNIRIEKIYLRKNR